MRFSATDFCAVFENEQIKEYIAALQKEHLEYTKISDFMNRLKKRQKDRSIWAD